MAGEVAVAIAAAKSKRGAPYVWGATGPNSFDCSGLTQWAWGKAGVRIPRTSQQQASFGSAVPVSKIRAGDLVTSNWGSGPSSHVALYLGSGLLIHAPRPGKPVTIARLNANYRAHVNAVRRVPGAKQAPGSDGGIVDVVDLGDIGDLLGGVAGAAGDVAGDLGGFLLGPSGLLGPLKTIASGTAEIAGNIAQMGAFATFLLKLALPSTWVRIVAGMLGTMLLILGLSFLIKETKA